MSVQQQSTPSEEQKETGDRYMCKVCYEKFSKLSIEFHYFNITVNMGISCNLLLFTAYEDRNI